MNIPLDLHQVLLILILIAAFFLLITEKIRVDLTAVIIIVALAVSGILGPEEALSGFSSEPAIVIAAIFVLSGAFYATGLSDHIGNWIVQVAGQGYNRVMVVMMLAVAALSAFTHHVTITAIMLPVTLKLCREQNISPSRLLMPMSFAASLGTTITILGAPAFLIADSLLKQAGQSGLGIFSIAPIGLVISVAGILFMLLAGRFLLPDRPAGDIDGESFRLDGYYTEILVLTGSDFIGKTIEEIENEDSHHFKVVTWLRFGRITPKPFRSRKVREGDVLTVRTTPEELAAIQEAPGMALHPVVKYQENGNGTEKDDDNGQKQLVQAVVAPSSELVGQTLAKLDFRRRYGLLVVGIWRQKGWMRAELSRVALRPGDVLVLMGDKAAISRLNETRAFLMLAPFHGEPQRRYKAGLVGGIMIVTVLAAAFNLLPVDIALLAGATAVILTRCISLQQAYKSIDTRIYVFIAGAIPLGLAMVKTGLSELIASWLQTIVAGWPPFLVLLILFVISAIITQLMSDAGTTALLGPVAVSLALALDQSPQPYVIAVAMAAVVSFLTPIGHHGNLLIYGPGRYQFNDFLKVGTPLTILVAIIVVLMALFLWPISN
ncbi:MAG TPA: SLC13 family permease [Anaerolineales bacterium]|nr:SLC13 family permease [Anaerolineales bacterium]